jgi:hypothetical protein
VDPKHLTEWVPAGEHGPGFYLCACSCGTTGRRMKCGPHEGQIKPRPSEAAALSMTTVGESPGGSVRDTTTAMERAVQVNTGGWSNRRLSSR